MEGITLYSIDYYKKSVFKGSYRGMNFRISKDGDEEEKKLLATAWKGPFILEKTKEKLDAKNFYYFNGEFDKQFFPSSVDGAESHI